MRPLHVGCRITRLIVECYASGPIVIYPDLFVQLCSKVRELNPVSAPSSD